MKNFFAAVATDINGNEANKTLAVAAVVFVIALAFHVAYPASIFADGFLFVAEAALVGGMADWFAVTALFEKPLGFPYHTAILPRRREAFIAASVTMVQKEFFSRRNVIAHLEKLHLLPMLMAYLAAPTTKERLLTELFSYAQKFITEDFSVKTASMLSKEIRRHLTMFPVAESAAKLSLWLKTSGEDKRLINSLGAAAVEFAKDNQTYNFILHSLEDYAKTQAKSPLEQLAVGLAQIFDLVNIDEAADLIHGRLIKIAEELAGDSPLTDAVIVELHRFLTITDGNDLANAEFIAAAEGIKSELVLRLPFEKMLENIFVDLREDPDALMAVVAVEYDTTLAMINNDDKLRRRVERFLYDLAARSALHAQGLIDVVVRKVLEKLTDAELNRLVREKIEPDLRWIRINGSLVGSAVGLVIFCVMTVLN